MNKKQVAGLVGAFITLLTSVALAIGSFRSSEITAINTANYGERVRAVEVRHEGVKERLDRIEAKLDAVLELKAKGK